MLEKDNKKLLDDSDGVAPFSIGVENGENGTEQDQHGYAANVVAGDLITNVGIGAGFGLCGSQPRAPLAALVHEWRRGMVRKSAESHNHKHEAAKPGLGKTWR